MMKHFYTGVLSFESSRKRTSSFNNGWTLTSEVPKSKIETTLGDLIVALTDEASGHVRDEQEAYEVVAYILANFATFSNRQSEQKQVH